MKTQMDKDSVLLWKARYYSKHYRYSLVLLFMALLATVGLLLQESTSSSYSIKAMMAYTSFMIIVVMYYKAKVEHIKSIKNNLNKKISK